MEKLGLWSVWCFLQNVLSVDFLVVLSFPPTVQKHNGLVHAKLPLGVNVCEVSSDGLGSNPGSFPTERQSSRNRFWIHHDPDRMKCLTMKTNEEIMLWKCTNASPSPRPNLNLGKSFGILCKLPVKPSQIASSSNPH